MSVPRSATRLGCQAGTETPLQSGGPSAWMVGELMRWGDELEARLSVAQATATHLLDATLAQLLAV